MSSPQGRTPLVEAHTALTRCSEPVSKARRFADRFCHHAGFVRALRWLRAEYEHGPPRMGALPHTRHEADLRAAGRAVYRRAQDALRHIRSFWQNVRRMSFPEVSHNFRASAVMLCD